MGIQAKITFSCLNNYIFPVRRVITLNDEVTKIQIGRASKSSGRCLHSAGDNAWLDSPVMSRDHAELCLDPESETLVLRDIGSMHGTWINNSQLVSYAPTQLRNGDVVVFGTEVKRGSETFPPCKFIINFEISSWKPANTFAYPESSDFDDDDDVSLIESEIEQHQKIVTSSEKNLKIAESLVDEKPQLKTCRILANDVSSAIVNDNFKAMASETKNLVIQNTSEDLQDNAQSPDIQKNKYNNLEPATSSNILGTLSRTDEMNEMQKLDTKKLTEIDTSLESKTELIDAKLGRDIKKDKTQMRNIVVNKSAKNYFTSGDESEIQNEYEEDIQVFFDDELSLTASVSSTEGFVSTAATSDRSEFPELKDQAVITNEVLGEKSGKLDYFRAREYNKAMYHSHMQRQTSVNNFKHLCVQSTPSLLTVANQNDSQQEILSSNTHILDEVSENVKKDNDIMQSNVKNLRQTKLMKRKADEISGDSDEKFQNYIIATSPTPVNSDSFTSFKKQKLMGNLGYVALGGFAAAASLFSILVATAPDFA